MTSRERNGIAVLTGDLVKSTQLSVEELESVRSQFLKSVHLIKKWDQQLVQGEAEFFRGDAWQLAIAIPGRALRIAVFLRAMLMSFDLSSKLKPLDTRIAIGIGSVDKISRKRVSLSTGEAFTISGRALDALKSERLTIEIGASVTLSEWFHVIGGLCDALIQQWTPRQAQVVSLAVLPENLTHKQIAEKLVQPVSKQAIGNILRSARWDALNQAVTQFEQTDWNGICSGSQSGS